MPRSPKHRRTTLAQTIRRFRVALGDTQQTFAGRLGLSITSVARYETNSLPALDVLEDMADVARKEGLPKFAELFEQNLPAIDELEPHEFAAARELLRRRADTLQPGQMNLAKFALALLSDSPALTERLDGVERSLAKRFGDVLQVVDEEITKWADENYLAYPEERAARTIESFKVFGSGPREQKPE